MSLGSFGSYADALRRQHEADTQNLLKQAEQAKLEEEGDQLTGFIGTFLFISLLLLPTPSFFSSFLMIQIIRRPSSPRIMRRKKKRRKRRTPLVLPRTTRIRRKKRRR